MESVESAHDKTKWYKLIEDEGIRYFVRRWLDDRADKRKLRYQKYKVERKSFVQDINESIHTNENEDDFIWSLDLNFNGIGLNINVDANNTDIITYDESNNDSDTTNDNDGLIEDDKLENDRSTSVALMIKQFFWIIH